MISGENMEPTEIETLLPWYAAGTLRRRDRQRVEDALRYDPALARHADLVREELAETISFNESLGVPSARCMDRLMAAIDAETTAARKRNSARAIAGQFAAIIAGFSPRTLAFAASFAVAAIALQAFLLVSMATKPQDTVRDREPQPHGDRPRHLRHGAFRPRSQRRRDHPFSRGLPGHPGRWAKARRLLSGADRHEVLGERGTRPHRLTYAPGAGRRIRNPGRRRLGPAPLRLTH